MDIVFLLIPLSLVLAIAIGAVFWWAVFGGQFEDLDRESVAILADEVDFDQGTEPPHR